MKQTRVPLEHRMRGGDMLTLFISEGQIMPPTFLLPPPSPPQIERPSYDPGLDRRAGLKAIEQTPSSFMAP